MGCFLGCFGFSSKRKRRKSAHGGLHRGQKLGGYEALDSAYANLDIKEEAVISQSELSKKPKETLKSKIRKKVSFNLNVQTYEPIPREEESENLFWENDGEGKREEKTSKKAAKERQSYPPNYRYGNCIDSYDDEDDEIASEECDLDDDDEEEEEEYYYDCDENIDVLRKSQEGLSDQFSSSPVSSEKRDSLTQLVDDRTKNLRSVGDSNKGGMNQNARDGSRCVLSVLKPVENLSQWKAVKAKGLAQVKQQRKENAEPRQQQEVQKSFLDVSNSMCAAQEIAMDASLSNWVVLSGSYQSNIEPISKSSTVEAERSYSWRNRDDMPNLDISIL